MRIITWNCKRATSTSKLWEYFDKLNPDIALLQEVSSLPTQIIDEYYTVVRQPRTKSGAKQRFSSIILSRYPINHGTTLTSRYAWVNQLLDHFDGNVLTVQVYLSQNRVINTVLVYSPPWSIPLSSYMEYDVVEVKLTQNPSLWVSDLVTSALHEAPLNTSDWLIGGDFNSCETFDLWKGGPRGNREWLNRMSSLGLIECLTHKYGKLVPTFKGPRMSAAKCQIDKLFVTKKLAELLTDCFVGDEMTVFGNKLSDHLPVTAEFDLHNKRSNQVPQEI